MPAEKIYVSPGVFTSEKDLTFVAQQVGVTTLGIVGETVKGPAFEPIFITDYDEYTTIFGGLNARIFKNGKPQYEASYIAKQYLTESNQLFITRILGLTGYDAGSAWAIVADANYNPTTVATATTSPFTTEFSGTTPTYYNFSNPFAEELITNNGGLGVSPYTGVGTEFELPGGGEITWTKVGGSFTGSSLVGEVTSVDGVTLTGTVSGTVYTYTASAYTDYENKVIAMIRSRADVIADTLYWKVDQSINGLLGDFSAAATNPLGNFTVWFKCGIIFTR